MNGLKKIDRKEVEDIYALTPMQEGMLFHHLKSTGGDLYFEQVSLRLVGEIDNEIFEAAWNVVIEANESLRTLFRWEGIKEPVQVVLNRHSLSLRYFDLSGQQPESFSSETIDEIKAADRSRGFDLRQVPFRVILCKLAETHFEMIVSFYHIILDGWSTGIILEEFFTAYSHLRQGKAPDPTPKPSFREYTDYLRRQETTGQRDFWCTYLKDLPRGAGTEPAGQRTDSLRGTAHKMYWLSEDIHRRLNDFAYRKKVTPASILYTAWGILLQCYHSRRDVLFDITVSGRTSGFEGIEKVVGLLINTLPLRVKSETGDTIWDLAGGISDFLRKRDGYALTSLEIINEILNGTVDHQLFDSLLVLENYPINRRLQKLDGDLRIDDVSFVEKTRHDVTVIFSFQDHLEMGVSYNSSLFNDRTADRLVRHFEIILATVLEHPENRSVDPDILDSKEREEMVAALERRQGRWTRSEAQIVPGRDRLEKILVEIWSQVLRVDKQFIGIDNDFFEFGGHSLRARNVAARILKDLKIKIPIGEIFNNPTIRGQADYIRRKDKTAVPSIPATEKKEYYVLSSAQKRMYLLQQMAPQSTAYNVPTAILLQGDLIPEQLTAAFDRLCQGQESLRTTFVSIDGEPVQNIVHHVKAPLDYKEIPEQEIEQGLRAFIKPFDLSEAPVFRTALRKLAAERFLLVVDIHHIIFDGISMTILMRDLWNHYDGAHLPSPQIHYKDYAEWLSMCDTSADIQGQEKYWQDIFFQEPPVLELPTDYPRRPARDFAGDSLYFDIDAGKVVNLAELEQRSQTTRFMTLAAAFNILLMKYSGQEDIVVGTVMDSRPYAELDHTIGVFVTTLALRNRTEYGMCFDEFLDDVKQCCLGAFENADYQFEELLKKANVTREPNRNPLFDTMLVLQNFDLPDSREGGMTHEPYRMRKSGASFDIKLTILEHAGSLLVEVEYATSLFKRTTIKRMAGHFSNILEEISTGSCMNLSDIRMITDSEMDQILTEFNSPTWADIPQKTVPVLIEKQVLRSPHAVTVSHRNRQVSYEYLHERATGLAVRIRGEGHQRDFPVGILMPRSILLVECILAVWKAGGAYIPVDAEYPVQRIVDILKDSGTSMLLTGPLEENRGIREHYSGRILELEDKDNPLTPDQSSDQAAAIDPEDLAYIIYTSGSTGRPKGAGNSHRGLFNLVNWYTGEFKLTAHDRVLLITSPGFDLTQKNIFAPLVAGGTLFIPSSSYFEGEAILKDVERRQITWLNCTPGMVYKLAEYTTADEIKSLSTLRYIFLGGEPITLIKLENWFTSGHFYAQLVNTYGPTECADVCSYYCITEPETGIGKSVPIGKPITNAGLYIVDRGMRPVPVGVLGELLIAGFGVGRGYMNDPVLTSNRFINLTFDREPAKRLYRTGDIARQLTDGNIDFIGRIDFQVKVRGFRIELAEIEARLLTHESVKEVVVIARSDEGRDTYLCAYITAEDDKPLSLEGLKSHLAAGLPNYMIPAYFVRLDRIPLSPNGKVDHKALPKPDGISLGGTAAFLAPVSLIENKLARIWQQMLNVKRVGLGDDFFELGGDSLLAHQVISRIREECRVEISLRKFFEAPTIAALAGAIESGKNLEEQAAVIPRAPRGQKIPLSFPQEGLWFLNQLDEKNTAYFVPRVVRIKGLLNAEIIEKTFNEIIRRHEILRTIFPIVEGLPIQKILEHRQFVLPVIDLSTRDEPDQIQWINQWLEEEGRRPFDFERGPMIRINLIRLRNQEHLLALTEHHLVHDGWTQGVLLKEFITIFSAYREGKPSPLRELPLQYGDFAYWQRNYLQGDILEGLLAYWEKRLQDLPPVLSLDIDRHRPPMLSGNGREIRTFLSKQLTDDLTVFSQRHGATLFMTMVAVFKVLLFKYTEAEDLLVGTGIANRRFHELEGMLGMVINTLVLRTHIYAEMEFDEYLRRVKSTCLEAFDHGDAPFEKVVEVVQPERSLSYNPLFQTAFSFMDTPSVRMSLPGLELEVEDVHNRSSKADINVIVEPPSDERLEETGGRIEILWEFNTDIMNEDTAETMLAQYRRLLGKVTLESEKPIHLLSILDDKEMHRLVNEFNDTGKNFPEGTTIVHLFKKHAEDRPDRLAVACEETSLSYRDLYLRSIRSASILINKGVLPDSTVGILLDRSVELMIGILAILLAGGAYLPIETSYPVERINYLLSDSDTRLVITKGAYSGLLKENCESIFVDQDDKIKERESEPAVINQSHHLAYIIYTSGSTGYPKGVLIEHCPLFNFLHSFFLAYQQDVGPADICSSTASISFDVSVFEFFTSVFCGAQLLIIPMEKVMDIEALSRTIIARSVTMAYMPPGLLRDLAGYLGETEGLIALNKMLVGVEPIKGEVLESYIRLNKRMRIINAYGPTEATICATLHAYCSQESREEIVPIGRPMHNNRILLLDREYHPVPFKAKGELCISGDGLARGYLNSVGLTAEKFIDNIYFPQERMYLTGDMARWLPDMNLKFCGRKDHQVKIRGYRVEPGEIENWLLDHTGIKSAVVITRTDKMGDKYLCAYVVTKTRYSPAELKKFLSGKIPEFMIPSYFVFLDRIPLTNSGKVDRNALPLPNVEAEDGFKATWNKMERRLVEIWSLVLGIDPDTISINQSFFDLGGHSLKATVLLAKIHKTLHIKISLSEFFANPTIQGLTENIARSSKEQIKSIEPTEKKEYYILSSAQTRLFFLDQIETVKNTVYNLPGCLLIEGQMDIKRLSESFHTLVKRHDSFRTSFLILSGKPVQIIHEAIDFDIQHSRMHAGHCPGEKSHYRDSEKKKAISEFIRPFDLHKAPLLRIVLLDLGNASYILLFDMHHIISDGISMAILVHEFVRIYQGEVLPELRLQYKDYQEWQNSLLASSELNRQKTYWIELLRDPLPVLYIESDYPRPDIRRYEGDMVRVELDKQLTEKIKYTLMETDTTLFILLLAAFNILLAKYSGQEDIIVGVPIAGRSHRDLENIIGMFVNTLPVRNYPVTDRKFYDFLMDVKQNVISAYENQDYPLEELVNKPGVKKDLSRNPLFDVLVVSEEVGLPEIAIEGVNISPQYLEKRISHLDLVLYIKESDDTVDLMLEFSTALFKPATTAEMLRHYVEILEQLTTNIGITNEDFKLSHKLLIAQQDDLAMIQDDFIL